MVLMVTSTHPFSRGGSWNHSEVPREAEEMSSSSGNETWSSVSYCSFKQLLLCQEHMFSVFVVSWFFFFIMLFWINLYPFLHYSGAYRHPCDYRVMSVILASDVKASTEWAFICMHVGICLHSLAHIWWAVRNQDERRNGFIILKI